MSSKDIGDPCPKCNKPLERRSYSFYWRGDYKDGAFCVKCNAIWPIINEEIAPLILAARRAMTIDTTEKINNETVVEKTDSSGTKCWCCGSDDLNWTVMYSVSCRGCGAFQSDLE